ncbi:ATP-binding cassette subfamily B protein [Spinactinospora alkalitolerans]|uniref:ATP-binding cassette subfamily B protein n=1 Tax=Spinactinospora alkalitolerans TaxID=687207 RepID=A0A852U1T2_9ACTN|nr:ABC transporter ATP-binding protein [Spinactinospora alkalitolerans]NYE49547.1 ATP-binding cassette subfamily B protein [Spinactinospora alkalitolerans]
MPRPKDLRESLPGLRRILGRMRPHMHDQRTLVAGGFIALFTEVAFRLLEPWPLKIVIDAVVLPQAAAGPRLLLMLALCGVTVVAFAGMRALAAYLMTTAFALVGSRVLTRVRAELFAHLQGLSLRYHQGARSGDLLTRLTGDVNRLQEVAVTVALPMVGNVVTLVGMSVVMLVLNWQLACLVLALFPVFVLFGSRDSLRINGAAREQRRREGELAGGAAEGLAAITVVQAYGLEPEQQRAFSASNDESLVSGVRATRLSAGLERRTDLLVGIATGLVVTAGGYAAVIGHLTPGELVVFVTYLKSAFKPMRDMAKYTGRIAKAAASGERVAELLSARPDIVDGPRRAPLPRVGEVAFEDVSLGYGAGRWGLRGLDLRVPARTRVGVVGPSGSGKSTMASLLLRLQDPTGGRVLVDGLDLRDLPVAAARSQVAVVLQESVLFATTIAENIRHGDRAASDREVLAAARAANAHDFISALPDGYDTVLGERGATLSGGQRQRIAIARAMLRRSPIVVLDEATTGLDPENQREVLGALAELTSGRTAFIISHDADAVADCDLIVAVHGGRVLRQGPPGEVLPGLRAVGADLDPGTIGTRPITRRTNGVAGGGR